MKKLSIGIQSFIKMREDNFYYVDKTAMMSELVNKGGGYYFLSRPRRFGKSLFLDTLRQAFLARKDLFSGLYLESNWDWDTRYPVIHISFGSDVIQDIADLGDRFAYILKINAQNGNVVLTEKNLRERFLDLIRTLSIHHHQKVVVLIDEYDKPILDNIDKPQTAMEIREGLKNFYSVIKDSDEFLKFVGITGVSKFSKVSLFSGLNNLQDITLDTMAATVRGYAHEEILVSWVPRCELRQALKVMWIS